MRRFLLVCLACLAPVLGTGCVEPRRQTLQIDPQVHRPARSVVIFFVDGLDEVRFNEMLDRSELPHIADRFGQRGVRVDRAVTSLPSITYPNATSLLTGLFPGHHGILGNHWFDRRTLQLPDYLHAK